MFRYTYLLVLLILHGFHPDAKGQYSVRLTNDWEFVKGDLGGIWESVRQYEKGSPESVPIWHKVTLPHCYNAQDAVDPLTNYYQGPAWYRTMLEVDNGYPDGRTILHFEGVGQKSEVYIYTTKVGEHIGGYDEWSVDITDAVAAFKAADNYSKYKGKIPLSIRVDNGRDLEMIPSGLSDFNIYGGIYRPINLRYLPALALDKIFATATVGAQGDEGQLHIRGRFHNYQDIKHADVRLQLLDPTGNQVAELTSTIKAWENDADLGKLSVKKPLLWSPEKPFLYRLVATVTSGKVVYRHEDKVGFRHVEFKEHGPFFLNGKRLLLRGTHRHEDHAGVGAAMTDAMILQEMTLMKEMGVNFIRLGHYQQSRAVLAACDSLGILVWEEIPWCRGGLGGERYKNQARRMLTNMVEQHYNHPSIMIWGLGNENDWPGDFTTFDKQEIRTFMKELHELSHRLDPARKTAIRRCDFCKDIVDIYSPSIWAGWYRGAYTDYKASSEDEMKKVKHFLHVEWGGDSHARRHAENPDNVLAKVKAGQGTDERAGDASLYGGSARVSKDGDWSESYICNLIDWHLKEQEAMPWLTGTAYWPFKDFSTPVRPDNPVPYVNQKGVLERDFKKKESFYVFQSYWSDKPMIHVYGHSWPVRWGERNEKKMVKIYSNLPEVELFVNGKSAGKKKRDVNDFPASGLHWLVALQQGENRIEAVGKAKGKAIRDTIIQQYHTVKWGKPTAMELRRIGQKDDEATIEVVLKDQQGNLCLDARNWVRFGITGSGRLKDNLGTSDGSRLVQLYNGRARIGIKLNAGKNVASVYSEGLDTAFITLEKEK